MKVCHLISGDLWAGAEMVALNLLKGLARLPDVQLLVILLNRGILSEEIRNIGLTPVIADEGNLSLPRLWFEIRRILGRNPPHIIHSHRYKENLLAYLARLAGASANLISTQHGMPEVHDGVANLGYRMNCRLNYWILSRKFDGVVAVSRDIERLMATRCGFTNNRLKVIHNGIVLPGVASTTKKKPFFNVGSAGRLVLVKGYPLLIEIAREVKKRDSRIIFHLAGDGPEQSSLGALIKRYGLQETFRLHGFLANMDAFYNELDVYVNTSYHEGIPMSVLEAMGRGLPVVAPEVGGLKEIIDDGIEGFLIKNREAAEFTQKILSLEKNWTLRQQIGLAAREKIVREFSSTRMAEEYYALYNSVVEINRVSS